MLTQIRKSEFTRLANVTAYAAGQLITNNTAGGAPLNFASELDFPGAQGAVTKVLVIKSGSGVANSAMNLFLFNANPGTENDASAFSLTYANRDTLAAVIQLSAFIANGTTASTEFIPTSQTIPIASVAGSDDLWGVLVATGAYTPASAESFCVRLYVQPEDS